MYSECFILRQYAFYSVKMLFILYFVPRAERQIMSACTVLFHINQAGPFRGCIAGTVLLSADYVLYMILLSVIYYLTVI